MRLERRHIRRIWPTYAFADAQAEINCEIFGQTIANHRLCGICSVHMQPMRMCSDMEYTGCNQVTISNVEFERWLAVNHPDVHFDVFMSVVPSVADEPDMGEPIEVDEEEDTEETEPQITVTIAPEVTEFRFGTTDVMRQWQEEQRPLRIIEQRGNVVDCASLGTFSPAFSFHPSELRFTPSEDKKKSPESYDEEDIF